jgi:hypothetical protein
MIFMPEQLSFLRYSDPSSEGETRRKFAVKQNTVRLCTSLTTMMSGLLLLLLQCLDMGNTKTRLAELPQQPSASHPWSRAGPSAIVGPPSHRRRTAPLP